jgi:hypothetical protein
MGNWQESNLITVIDLKKKKHCHSKTTLRFFHSRLGTDKKIPEKNHNRICRDKGFKEEKSITETQKNKPPENAEGNYHKKAQRLASSLRVLSKIQQIKCKEGWGTTHKSFQLREGAMIINQMRTFNRGRRLAGTSFIDHPCKKK